MSLIIKGMEMPKACEWCSFISTFTTESGLGCRCEVEKFEFWDYSKRQENCPLVEIPTPHGRLIDADELKKNMRNYYPSIDHLCCSQHVVTKRDIDCAPTIIEAEASAE